MLRLAPTCRCDEERGFIVDDSDLGIAVRELEKVSSCLSRMSLQLAIKGIEEAPPIDFP